MVKAFFFFLNLFFIYLLEAYQHVVASLPAMLALVSRDTSRDASVTLLNSTPRLDVCYCLQSAGFLPTTQACLGVRDIQ